jgi:hypothetical protein
MDLAYANAPERNALCLGDGSGGFSDPIRFGSKGAMPSSSADSRPYLDCM